MKASNAARAAILVEALDGLPRTIDTGVSLAAAGMADIDLDPATSAKLLPFVRRLIQDELTQIGVVLDVGTAASEVGVMIPGSPFGDGFFAGKIIVDGKTYALVVAPKAVGEIGSVVWKKDWQKATPGTQSVNDGMANTEAMIAAGGHPIADWITKIRRDWHEDAYIPSRDELELIYRNLKPTTSENWTYDSRADRWSGTYNGCDDNGNGHNASSAPVGVAYSEMSPTQTTASVFRDGGEEAMSRAWYWTSTEFGPGGAWVQGFGGGAQSLDAKANDYRCRAVRKVLI